MNISKLTRFILQIPFTITILSLLVLGAFFTKTHLGELSSPWFKRLGFSASDLWLLRWERLITSALVTDRPRSFWQAFGIIALAVGASERLLGTRRTAFTFWGVHFTTLGIQSLLVGSLHWLDSPFGYGTLLTVTRDVGPSAGYFAILGLLCRKLPKPFNRIVGFVAWVLLLGTMFRLAEKEEARLVKLLADMAHAIAFPFGWLSISVR